MFKLKSESPHKHGKHTGSPCERKGECQDRGSLTRQQEVLWNPSGAPHPLRLQQRQTANRQAHYHVSVLFTHPCILQRSKWPSPVPKALSTLINSSVKKQGSCLGGDDLLGQSSQIYN